MSKHELIEAAEAARGRAYAPYSHYTVGAALRTTDGTIFTGCNVENAVYPATICAERVAMTKAVSEGYHDFEAMAVATENGGMPCGICRQVMREFAPTLHIFIVEQGEAVAEYTLGELLPHSFGPEQITDATP